MQEAIAGDQGCAQRKLVLILTQVTDADACKPMYPVPLALPWFPYNTRVPTR